VPRQQIEEKILKKLGPPTKVCDLDGVQVNFNWGYPAMFDGQPETVALAADGDFGVRAQVKENECLQFGSEFGGESVAAGIQSFWNHFEPFEANCI